jgi:uncharacterized protein involved in response to NO
VARWPRAVSTSDVIGWGAAAVIDCAFMVVVVSVAAREIVAGKSWRNLRVLVLISMLAVGNILFHLQALQAHFVGTTEYGTRLGIAAAVMLLSVIGGRIVPSFRHNWLEQASPGRLPVAFGRFDMIALLISAAALLLWVAVPIITGSTRCLRSSTIVPSVSAQLTERDGADAL